MIFKFVFVWVWIGGIDSEDWHGIHNGLSTTADRGKRISNIKFLHPWSIFLFGLHPSLHRDTVTHSLELKLPLHPTVTLPCAIEAAAAGRGRERKVKKERPFPKCSFLACLFWAQRSSSTDELSTGFLTQWCQSLDWDVFAHKSEKHHNCWQNAGTDTNRLSSRLCVQLVSESTVSPNDTFALNCFIKEAYEGDGRWTLLPLSHQSVNRCGRQCRGVFSFERMHCSICENVLPPTIIY